MARAAADKPYRTFINGFVTEATGLTFPENCARDIDNCDLELKGSVRRRLGLNEEAGGQVVGSGLLADQTGLLYGGPLGHEGQGATTPSTASQLAVTVHQWPAPGGRTDLNFVVFQIGNYLVIRNWDSPVVSDVATISPYVTQTTSHPTPGPVPGTTIQLDDLVYGYVYRMSRYQAARTELQSAVGFNRLWITGAGIVPVVLDYNYDQKLVTAQAVGYDVQDPLTLYGRLSIRDFNGVPDGLATEENPATLSKYHKYNLLNQGWTTTYMTAYFTSQSNYPSNAQQWILGKDTNDDFDPTVLVKQDFGNSPAPKGKARLHALLSTRFTAFPGEGFTALDDMQDEYAEASFTTCAFYGGRVWFAGDRNSKRPNGVYFSKTLQKALDAGVLMQENDPTSEIFSDLLATDGGVIYITEANNILRLIPFGTGLLVMATNGIWFISGTSDGGFSATNFAVDKVSATGILSASSVVSTEQQVFFFAENSIHALALPEQGTVPGVVDIANTKIFSFYGLIKRAARAQAQACFDPASKKVFWSYRDDPDEDGEFNKNLYHRMLILDTRTGAFTKYSFLKDENNVFGNGPAFPKRTISAPSHLTNVVVEGQGNVVTSGAGEVMVFESPFPTDEFVNSIKVLVFDYAEQGMRIAEFHDTQFLDYAQFPEASNYVEQDYASYIITGDELLGDLQRKKQATYLHSFFQRTETGFEVDEEGNLIAKNPSGCQVTARWDWHNTQSGGRWSNPQRAYRYRRPYSAEDVDDTFDTGEEIVYTKLKVRGQGRALVLRYDSETGKDFQLLGYSVAFTADGV